MQLFLNFSAQGTPSRGNVPFSDPRRSDDYAICSDENGIIDVAAKTFFEDKNNTLSEHSPLLCYVICDSKLYAVHGDFNPDGDCASVTSVREVIRKNIEGVKLFSDMYHGLHCVIDRDTLTLFDSDNNKNISTKLTLPPNPYFISSSYWLSILANCNGRLSIFVAIRPEHSSQFYYYSIMTTRHILPMDAAIVSHCLINDNCIMLFYATGGEIKCLFMDRVMGGEREIRVGEPERFCNIEEGNKCPGKMYYEDCMQLYSGVTIYTSLRVNKHTAVVEIASKKMDPKPAKMNNH